MSTVTEQFNESLKNQAFDLNQPSQLKGSDTNKKAGDFVLQNQQTSGDVGFRNVSKKWYVQTQSFEQGLEALDKGRAVTEDIMATVNEMKPSVDKNGVFCFQYKDGREFRPTKHATSQIGNWAGTGTWFVGNLTDNPTNAKGVQLYSRDKGDAETLAHVVQNGFRRIDQEKRFLWRTRKDGTMRAMLSDRYAIVDNRWLLEKIQSIIPGGRLSHWKGDSDTLYGNILIPDTIREEKDSDYGGMLSIGNSEIGERPVSSWPSIFRAICMNGCIWGQELGQKMVRVHRGEINLEELYNRLKDNLTYQIPLLPQGIDMLLGTRAMGWGGVSIRPVMAQVSKTLKFDRQQSIASLDAWEAEKLVTPDYAHTMFGVVNGITRAAQVFGNDRWVNMDAAGGRLAQYSKEDWGGLVTRAKHMKAKDVDEMFEKVAVAV